MSEEQSPVHQRLNFLLDELENGNQAEFARRIGVRSGVIGDMFGKRRNKPSFDLLAKICSTYPQLRVEWLLTGEGEMLKPARAEDTTIKNSVVSEPDMAVPVSLELLRGDTIEQLGMPGFNYPAPDVKPKKIGLDLVDQLARNTEAIQALKAAVLKIQEQLK